MHRLFAFGALAATVTMSSTYAQLAEGTTTLASEKPPQRDLSKANTRIILIHMIFMITAWLILAPAAILIARFGRTLFKWYPYHRNIQIATMIFFIIGFALGIVAAQPDPLSSKKHYQVGVAIFITFFFQCSFGLISHRLKGRWVGYSHAIIGLTLFGLSMWNIQTGFNIWDWKAGSAPKIVVYAWMGLLIALYLAGFAFLPREIKQHRQKWQVEEKDTQHIPTSINSLIDSNELERGRPNSTTDSA